MMVWGGECAKLCSMIENQEEWEGYVEEADKDIDSGWQIIKLLTYQKMDMPANEVARVAAPRRRLVRELKATTTLQKMLVDVMVVTHIQQLQWLELLSSTNWVIRQRKVRSKADYDPDTVRGAFFDELSALVIPTLDRLNRQLLRTVKAYRDLKTSPIVVNIGQARQVNIGTEQQLNISSGVIGEPSCYPTT